MGARQPEKMLEIGTAVGFSGMLLCHHAGENARLDTIEKVPQRIRAARENFARYGMDGRITLWEGDAAEVLEEMVAQGRNYDFIFMDAAKGQYLRFLPDILALLEPGGMLVTDNVLQGGDVLQSRYAITKRDRTIHKRMRQYLYTLTHSQGLNTVILPVGDGVTLTTV
jgi:Predicted O-methyltransferase